MGFAKYARAAIVQPAITRSGWDEIRTAALALGSPFRTPGREIRVAGQQVVLDQYDPNRFLLSHCSIIASVDTESPVGMPLGVQMHDGVQIDRKYADFYISTATSKYINNNNDCWSRDVLLSSYKTFIGGENYVEHIQIPELSKGKIIDAAARDIGDSIYVDILVATDKKHKPLIEAISSGQLSTLSMGCHVAFTICTKCGNRAEDELQLCNHIKYNKGNSFIDSMGRHRKIAELCGHIQEEPGSVKFIEGSWVANPAFTGAVLRNILTPNELQMATMRQKVQVAFSEPARAFDPSMLQKAARYNPFPRPYQGQAVLSDHLPYLYEGPAIGQLYAPKANSALAKAEEARTRRLNSTLHAGQQEDFEGQGDMKPKAPESDSGDDPLRKVVDDLYTQIRKQVSDRVKEDIAKGESGKIREVLDENQSNESLIKSACRFPKWQERARAVLGAVQKPSAARAILAGLILYERGGWEAVRRAKRFTGKEVLVISRMVDNFSKKASRAGDGRLYTTVIAVGGIKAHSNLNAYLTACRQVLGRALRDTEKAQLIEKGKLFSIGL